MKATFADTSFLLALVLSDDEHHRRAVAWQACVAGPLVTTEYVLVEFVDALVAGHLRDVALQTVTLLRTSPAVRVVSASSSLLEDGLTLFRERRDKNWGLTDCISFVVMERESIEKALTTDHHFEQAGFVALLRSEPPTQS